MAKRKQTRNKLTPRKLIIIGTILLAVSLCGLLAVHLINKSISSPSDEPDITSVEENENNKEKKDDQKKDSKDSDDKNPTEDKEGDKVEHINYEGENPNKSGELTGIITSSQVSGETLRIRVSIDQFLSAGSCELTIKKSEITTYEDVASIFSDASTSTCEGFDVPVSNLENGKLKIEIKLISGEKTGKIEGEVEI